MSWNVTERVQKQVVHCKIKQNIAMKCQLLLLYKGNLKKCLI